MKENKINIAELLKDCPKGMELDCAVYDNITLFGVEDMENTLFPIKVLRSDGCKIHLTKYGQYADADFSKCIIYPKGKTTWEGFVPPCKFKDGDIVFYNDTIAIFKEWGDETLFRTYVTKYLCCDSLIDTNVPLFGKSIRKEIRFATEEEKQKLFDAIKANGYKWNEETKTLEKLVEPKFKIGDKIRHKSIKLDCILREYSEDILAYRTNIGLSLTHKDLEDWELIPNKFDITTFKPFDKVLVRGGDGQKWTHDFFGFMDKDKGFPFVCVGYYVSQCIPYEGNEHLLGKTDDCDEYFKTWKK